MKKLTSTVFAALLGLTLSMPAFSQATQTPPDNSKKSAPASKDDTKDKKSTKKAKKPKASKKTDSTTTSTDKNAPAKK